MVIAVVTCQSCRTLVPMGKERWRNNRAFCPKCYDEGKEAALAKTVAKMAKASGFDEPPVPKKLTGKAKKVQETLQRCETCSGSETRCTRCGGLMCRPKAGEECEQMRHGKMCLKCYDEMMKPEK